MLRFTMTTILKGKANPMMLARAVQTTTTMDAVELAEVRETVHLIPQEYQPNLQVSNVPLSKIARAIKTANEHEAAAARARDIEFRDVHGRVRGYTSSQTVSMSPILTAVSSISVSSAPNLATVASLGSASSAVSGSTTQARPMTMSATPHSIPAARMMARAAQRATISGRIQAAVASGCSAADLDSAFG